VLLAHPEYLSLLLPVFRKDMELMETYLFEPEPPLAVPITAFGGLEDTVPRESLERWRAHTERFGGARLFPGDHFYLNTQREQLFAALAEVLAPALRG
jgi:medium-chain acyl-[acyl-carrier-protein] hydrolase